jgi:hypothetical protein
MKLFAVQTTPTECPVDTLCGARKQLGGTYIHRCANADPYLMVCAPSVGVIATKWLTANGWTVLPDPRDFGTPIGAAAQALLVSHAPDVLATDTCPAAMQKIVAKTGMQCYSPF